MPSQFSLMLSLCLLLGADCLPNLCVQRADAGGFQGDEQG
eukprot:CAMPEP_0184311344 /NCGR_PEP_ID=MMETSP1049-20130417/41118_1 /TAXON_ID=77928 /ORGANISM="Proteomonas sulcata, Strain CCMP704" /LENGTH=39 /DNA_ID= /DNA_START= /DNA_END= /DNA_ORIENTATION=